MTGDPLEARRSPLGGARHGDAATVALAEVPFLSMTELVLDPRDRPAVTRVAEVGGGGLPGAVGATGLWPGGRRACAVGPDRWLVVGPAGDDGLVDDLDAALAGTGHGAAVDVSAQRTTLRVTGPATDLLLRHVWPGDLDRLGPGRCRQGLLGRSQALVLREASPGPVLVVVRASFARYAWDVLVDAAVEYVEPGAAAAAAASAAPTTPPSGPSPLGTTGSAAVAGL